MATPDDDLTEAARQLTEILVALTDTGQWLVLPTPNAVMTTRAWPDHTVDTAVFTGLRAYAQRENPAGQHVWHARGTATQVKAALDALLPPDTAGAPDTTGHTPARTGAWDP